MRYLISIIIGFCLSLFSANAQFTSRLFKSFDPAKLPSPFVKDILKDKSGFIWLATRSGVCRFDGENYKTYNHRPSDKHSLGFDHVRCFYEDPKGFIWMGTFGAGLSRFDPKSQKFDNFPIKGPPVANRVHEIVADSTGRIWLATEGGGLLSFNPNSKKYTSYQFRGVSGIDRLITLSLENQHLWIGGIDGKLLELNINTLCFRVIRGLPSTTVWGIQSFQDSMLAIGTLKGLFELNRKTNSVNVLLPVALSKAFPDNRIFSMAKDQTGNLWLATTCGLGIYHPKTKQFEPYPKSAFRPHGQKDNTLIGLHIDTDGLAWIGTWSEGFENVAIRNAGFLHIESMPGTPEDSTVENIQSLLYSKSGHLWASTYNGLACVDLKTNQIKKFLADSNRAGSLPINRLGVVFEDSRRRLWVATQLNMGLFQKSEGKNFFTKMEDTLTRTKKLLTNVFCMAEDNKQNIWIASFGGGMVLWKEEEKRFENFAFQSLETNIPLNQIKCLAKAKDGSFWLGTNGGGLVHFNPETKDYQVYAPEGAQKHGLTSGNINAIVCTPERLWLATEAGGLFYTDLNSHIRFHNISTANGLPEMNILALVVDNQNNIWMGGKGIYCLPGTESKLSKKAFYHIKTYLSGQLLLPQRFSTAISLPDGRLVFGGSKGLVIFHPKKLELPSRPCVSLSSLTVQNQHFTTDSLLNEKKQITLKAGQNFLAIGFANVNFFGQDQSQCFYRLWPLQKEWISTGPAGEVRYAGLQPGNYDFQIFARNEQGLKSKLKSFGIIINAPWWQSLWFYALIGLAGVGLTYLFVRWQVERAHQNEQHKNKQEREKLELEVKALRAQMNPHFMFNALNSIDHFIWKNDVLQASEYLVRFSKLMRLVLEHSRYETISFKDELECLSLYILLEQKRMDHPFTFELNLNEEDDLMSFQIPPMLLQPFVENAIFHGLLPRTSPGKLIIQIYKPDERTLKIIIEDNGVGRSDEAQQKKANRKSLGLEITKERIYKLKEAKTNALQIFDLKNDDGQAVGTRIEILLPAIVD